jgi:glycosyltransferase involved in cell wall biosynthesis
MKTEAKIKIATVYKDIDLSHFIPYLMCDIRWLRISEALARAGFKVDIIMDNEKEIMAVNENLRYVSPHAAKWREYDVIKTVFHEGFDFITKMKADDHPFIISKLGSVVGKRDNVDGVYFYGDQQKELYEIQKNIARKSKYVTILTKQSKKLWIDEFGDKNNILLIPTGTDEYIPPPGKNPYPPFKEKIAVYIGNIYSSETQKEINHIWQMRLNKLGRLLKKRGIRLCLVAGGEANKIDRDAVTLLGSVEHDKIWDYQYFADVGIVLAQGKIQHNESSKIYYYIRTGLPVVSEDPVPNNNIIQEANLGFTVSFGDYTHMADKIEEAIYHDWDKEAAINHILKYHTWDKRVKTYGRIIRKEV